MNGADFVRHVCGSRAKVFAILISAYTDERTIKAARDAGATFMSKSIDYQLLVRWVREGSA
jgi:DNA-binding NarL/FixJ family response regulator